MRKLDKWLVESCLMHFKKTFFISSFRYLRDRLTDGSYPTMMSICTSSSTRIAPSSNLGLVSFCFSLVCIFGLPFVPFKITFTDSSSKSSLRCLVTLSSCSIGSSGVVGGDMACISHGAETAAIPCELPLWFSMFLMRSHSERAKRGRIFDLQLSITTQRLPHPTKKWNVVCHQGPC